MGRVRAEVREKFRADIGPQISSLQINRNPLQSQVAINFVDHHSCQKWWILHCWVYKLDVFFHEVSGVGAEDAGCIPYQIFLGKFGQNLDKFE